MVVVINGVVIARGRYYLHSAWMTVIKLDPGYQEGWYQDQTFRNEIVEIDPYQWVIPRWTDEARDEYKRHYFPEDEL